MKELTLSSTQLRARLGLALRTARAGGRVVVTSHGRPIAVIQKISDSTRLESPLDRKLKRLDDEGRLSLGMMGPLPRIRADRSRGIVAQVEADRR